VLAVAALLMAAPMLGGCQIALLDPKGPIGADEKSIIILATCLMMIVVLPVIGMTIAFAWRYRASNTDAAYSPDWAHSNRIELVVWAVPCLIIAVLAAVTWISTHELDPYRPIATNAEPLDVEVVSLDWKWLFIYPEEKIASINELALPVGRPVRFRLTSDSVMNSFFIPRLGSQIYTMAGMETKLSLLASAPGRYQGISANYSGDGFSDMTFGVLAVNEGDFAHWVEKARASQQKLTPAAYRTLKQPSEKVPVAYYGDVAPTVYHDALNRCADGSSVCTDHDMNDMKMGDTMKTDDAMKLAATNGALGGEVDLCRGSPTKAVQ
jgi:cytochrome o ubiquinol oxidase subunit II